MEYLRPILQPSSGELDCLFPGKGLTETLLTHKCPKQLNATDCGAFVCAYAELLSAGDTPSGKTINPLKREKT
ncbi:hypothetical protein J6590_091094 [Homalodisca vitripennis]|nr:hypothetical protein J6590_091094 [Homalodisca vitripennis]